MTLLEQHGRLSVGDIQTQLSASPATIRRDLGEMERLGTVVRTHGGIIHPSVLQGEPVFQRRAQIGSDAKRAIAERAAREVDAGMVVYIDSGTSALAVASLLVARRGLTIVTNSIPILALSRSDGATIVSTGGTVRVPSQSLVGSDAHGWLSRIRVDVAIIGASGLSPQDGPSVTSLEECATKRGAIERATRTILIADASKWGRPALIAFAGWPAIDTWITDAEPVGPEAARVCTFGTRIIACEHPHRWP